MTTSNSFSELQGLRRLGVRGCLLVLPFLAIQLSELFVLPIDFFTFRVWEAALSLPYRYPGMFYPNLHVEKNDEYGDQYRSGNSTQKQAKHVEWYTDSFGWRNRPDVEKREKYDAVVLGDSNIVGSFLDQKDTLTEVLGARSQKTVYSYSVGHDHISLFFNDPRLLLKAPQLLVVETRVGTWNTNDSYLSNFREMPDGSLDVIDRSTEFTDYFYDPSRQVLREKITSRLTKQPMFHWLKATLATNFTVPERNKGELYFGQIGSAVDTSQTTWRPANWIVSSGIQKPLMGEPQPAVSFRATGANAYWHSEQFVSGQPDGKIVFRFQARNSVAPSRHRLYIFEDGSYRSIGELVARAEWQSFEIPVLTKPGSVLELQIDQMDHWQSLSLRDIQVVGAASSVRVSKEPVNIPMSGWTGEGASCEGSDGDNQNCRRWSITGKSRFVQSPILPKPGDGGIQISFEARTDKPAPTFTSIYLFDGPAYRQVAQYAFDSRWHSYTLVVQPDGSVPTKIQVDFPESVDSLMIRNFKVTPADRPQ